MTKRLSPSEKKRRAAMMEMVRELGITDANELYAALRDLFADTMEEMLQAELDEHLGYEKHDQTEKANSNRRNGSTPKKVQSHAGETTIQVPRDREASFEPQLVRKGQKDVSQIEEKVMSMYAKGMSDRDISSVIEDIYGFSISHDTVSKMVERVQPRFEEWQSRGLESMYAFVYVDAMMVKVKQDGKARNKAVYTALGIDMQGHKEVLGLWLSESEGAHFWMVIFDELRARGVERILFVCVDGLSGMEEAIRTIYPQSHVQRCMVHLVRNSLRFIPTKHYKAFCQDVKAIYGAVSLSAAREALAALEAAWRNDYPSATRVWTEHFDQVEQLFTLPSEIRRIIYTTNAVEGLHSALRKVTNGKGAFPTDSAVMKALYLRMVDVSKKWSMPIPNWALVLGQLSVLFPDLLC